MPTRRDRRSFQSSCDMISILETCGNMWGVPAPLGSGAALPQHSRCHHRQGARVFSIECETDIWLTLLRYRNRLPYSCNQDCARLPFFFPQEAASGWTAFSSSGHSQFRCRMIRQEVQGRLPPLPGRICWRLWGSSASRAVQRATSPTDGIGGCPPSLAARLPSSTTSRTPWPTSSSRPGMDAWLSHRPCLTPPSSSNAHAGHPSPCST